MRHTPPPPVDIAAIIPEFAPLARTTVRLHPRRGKASLDQSKVGGMFLWPAGEDWPVCGEHHSPLVPVLQLRADDVPEIGFPEGCDTFQLLWCPNDHEKSPPLYAPSPRVFWRERRAVKDPLPWAPAPVLVRVPGIRGDFCPGEDYCPEPCVLYPERVTEFPDVFDLADDLPELCQKVASSNDLLEAIDSIGEYDFEDAETLYQYWLSVAPGTKVGGHPEWVQDPEWPICGCGSRMQYFLTIASAEFDGGSWGRWLAEEDRHVWGGGYDVRKPVQCAANIMLGDMGNLNFFICRRCEGWPISAVFQCS